MTTNELHNLAETLLAAPHPASWAWQAGDDYPEPDAYLDCSQNTNGRYCLEVGDGTETAQITMSVHDLAEIHQRLTVQLMVARMQDQRSEVDEHHASANRQEDHHTAGREATDDNADEA
jgi:hypothetical protein